MSKFSFRKKKTSQTKQPVITNELVFKTAELLEFISKFVTLLPGDLISTGTPSGVGCFRDPPIFLKHGDFVRCEIDHLGVVENKMVDLSHKRSSM